VNVRLATPVKRIFRVGDKITGVVAEDRSGNMVHVDAGAVIVAAGGFNDETEMVKKYSSFEFKLDRHGDCEEGDLFFLCPNLRLTGDGIKMAQEVGADKGSIGIGPLPHVPGPAILGRAPGIMLSQLRIVQEQPYLWVNQQGVRFMDEALMNDHLTSGNLVARQKNKCAYIIFDEDTKRHLEEEGLDYEYFLFQAKKLVDLKGDFLKVIGRGNKHAFIADTLEDLAGQTGIDPVVLRKTVDEYNGYCERGHDDQYAKDPKFLRPIRKGKFYAVRVLSAAYQTIGGIKVNRKMEAMTNELKVIPGLYAAGDIIAAELFGDPPTVGIGTLSVALATGIVAGESALQYIRD
jgi:fumarate reductase flavoprotein subunit